jgi:hypothetical protein
MKLRTLAFIAIVAMFVIGPACVAASSEVNPGWLIWVNGTTPMHQFWRAESLRNEGDGAISIE